MNGLKIDTPEELKLIAEKDLPMALGLIFEGIKGIQKQCDCRLKKCEKKFVTKKEVYIVGACLTCLLIGLGILNWDILLKLRAILFSPM